jgi:thiamine-monophosphate kinase
MNGTNNPSHNTTDREQFLINTLHSKHIGDDAAVIGNRLYSMDAFFEDVHFKREWMSMAQIGRKAMLVNLSDAIAMNATPEYALVTLSLPKNVTYNEIQALSKSLEQTAGEYGCEIIGGDTIGGDKLHLSITIISHSKTPLLRKGLQEGNLLAYTGTLGESKRDLAHLLKGEKIEMGSRFFEPTLRQTFIAKARPLLQVGMDISDGLFCDTNKLLAYNNLGLDLFNQIDDNIGLSGEEYEMLIGFNEQHLDDLKKVAQETHTPLTLVGKVTHNTFRFKCHSHHF